ncbi:phosphoribosylaminoimidazolesuccinocarboxamide synthase [Candidatus Kaiserbacteria bacterium RIFCSPLOWO2_01_FULL_53_17]|uniref:Phosphoribosylaminoimidazole-succinocarboxamide synthase n=1 Tax=Candidatus Kaiserbacteria bacterium RIFCSPLOWO2_01_FULL_53_17 TaxID=1798511 RepID=A0A1F6EI89_9BACT|nr:MAG: phosphoribosylaminoimidazolesuccinocarboxamide synthase [Candidatus Kaiserbacteria bacterium RIFCSPLOWO2_01_FULL_53_17]
MTDVLRSTDFQWLGEKYTGKVRDVYAQENRLILITTDRHSSFDRIIAHIPHKGQVLNQISEFWFDATKDIVPNHVLEIPDPNVTIGRKCFMLPVEAVVRGYITGVTGTSLWTLYSAGKRDFGNFTLPDGMKKNQKLGQPVFTPSTKKDTHDRTLSPQEMVAEGIIEKEMIEQVEKVALALFARGQEIAIQQGLILVDTKYEFGLDSNGVLTLIDEIHTPDSSRFWQLDSYEARFSQGEEPEYFDKEFLRLWFKENCDPYKDETLPEAPQELVDELSRRYIRMYEQITRKTFEPGETPVVQRLEKALRPYAV